MSDPPNNPTTMPGAHSSLNDLRARIDEIDARLINALAERARAVQEIGRLKRETGGPAYVPHREQEVLSRVLAANPGPLPNRTIEAIYRELMSGSFALEAGLTIGYLGPAGSFSHLAALRQFGSSVEYDDLHTIDAVFEEVAAGRIDYGLVPYENSIGGGITDTLDAFQEFDVRICAETLVEITHCLLANCLPSEVARIYSKPQVFDQCRKWIQKHYPKAELIATASSAAAVREAGGSLNPLPLREGRVRVPTDMARSSNPPSPPTPLPKGEGSAAIGSALAGEIYGVKVLFDRIEDKPNNITRFLVITTEGTKGHETKGEGATRMSAALHAPPQSLSPLVPQSLPFKTTLMFATADKPGALVDVLNVFRDANINLSHIEKRPSGRVNWEYTFFIDCAGSQDDAPVRSAIEEARGHCLALKVLGSYPRAERVL